MKTEKERYNYSNNLNKSMQITFHKQTSRGLNQRGIEAHSKMRSWFIQTCIENEFNDTIDCTESPEVDWGQWARARRFDGL